MRGGWVPVLVLPCFNVAGTRRKTRTVITTTFSPRLFFIDLSILSVFSQDMPLIWSVNGILAFLNGHTLRLIEDLIHITVFTRDVGTITSMNASGFWIFGIIPLQCGI